MGQEVLVGLLKGSFPKLSWREDPGGRSSRFHPSCHPRLHSCNASYDQETIPVFFLIRCIHNKQIICFQRRVPFFQSIDVGIVNRTSFFILNQGVLGHAGSRAITLFVKTCCIKGIASIPRIKKRPSERYRKARRISSSSNAPREYLWISNGHFPTANSIIARRVPVP